MKQRVLATPQAVQYVKQLQQLVQGSLQEDLQKLDNLGQQLADPNKWDGTFAQRFRTEQWPQAHTAHQNLIKQLTELQQQVDKWVEDILRAGGAR